MPYVKRFEDANYFREFVAKRIGELERQISEDQAELARLKKALRELDKANWRHHENGDNLNQSTST